MDNHEFAKLQKWLCQWKKQLEGRMEAGELAVLGWLKLNATIQDNQAWQSDLEAEVKANATERQQLAEQIKNLQEKQEQLEIKNQQLQAMKKLEELAALGAESQSIAVLCKKEEAALAKLTNKFRNPYFMEDLDSGDVSTVFSMFNMDSFFPRFKRNDEYNNLEVTVNAWNLSSLRLRNWSGN